MNQPESVVLLAEENHNTDDLSEFDIPICRYCLESQIDLKDIQLINPCKCTNPICQKCFNIKIKLGDDTTPRCELCREPFTMTIDVLCSRSNSSPNPLYYKKNNSHLVQRIYNETPDTTVEIGTNFTNNTDTRIIRCMQSVIHVVLWIVILLVLGYFCWIIFLRIKTNNY